jgi:hypothetical protein
MKYFQVKEVRFGSVPDWNDEWNRVEVVFRGNSDVNPLILARMEKHKYIRFPEEEVRLFAGRWQRTYSKNPLVVKDRSVILSFGIYGGREISLKDIWAFANDNVLPMLNAAYARVEEIRDILLVLKEAGEVVE